VVLDQVTADVDDRRLGEAADDLVRARYDEVRARGESVDRQIGVERQVRAPRLVHDEWHAAGVRDIDEALHVGDRAEVGGRRDVRADCVGGVRQRLIERLGSDAVGDPELGVELGLDEARPQPRHDQAVDGARVRRPLHDDLVAQVGERKARHVVALRRAVQEKPRAPGTPRLRGELLRALPRRRLGAEVDALDERRNVERQGAVAEGLAELGIRARAALVARDMEAAGPTGRIGAQRVEVGRFGLDQASL
jgi:hypothetical protein